MAVLLTARKNPTSIKLLHCNGEWKILPAIEKRLHVRNITEEEQATHANDVGKHFTFYRPVQDRACNRLVAFVISAFTGTRLPIQCTTFLFNCGRP